MFARVACWHAETPSGLVFLVDRLREQGVGEQPPASSTPLAAAWDRDL